MTEDFQEDFAENERFESEKPEEVASESKETERLHDASEQQQTAYQPVKSPIFETGPDDLENAFEAWDSSDPAVQEYNNTSSPYIEDDSFELIKPAIVKDRDPIFFSGEPVIEKEAEGYTSPVDEASVDSPFQEEMPAFLDNNAFQETEPEAIFENPSEEFVFRTDELALSIPQQVGTPIFAESVAFDETDPGDLERSFEDAFMFETAPARSDYSEAESTIVASPKSLLDEDELEDAFEKVSPIQDQQGNIAEVQNIGDYQELVGTNRDESHRGYIVAHDRMGFYSLKGGISIEDAEKLIAEREEKIRSASTPSAESLEQKIADNIQIGEIKETPTNEDPASKIGTVESLEEIEQASLLGDEAASDVTQKITELLRTTDTTTESPASIESLVWEPRQENQEQKPIEVGEISTNTPIDFYAETFSDSSTLTGGDWDQDFTTAAKLYPERAFEQAVYLSDTPFQVKDVVEEMISEVPPSHLAGISECEVYMAHDSEQITMETRPTPGGGLKLCLYFPAEIDPDVARELIYTKVATHVENLLRNGCLTGQRDWIEIERRLEPNAPVSYEAEKGVGTKFTRMYMLNRTNAPLLKMEFTSEEPYWFMQNLDNQTTLDTGVES